MSKMIRGYAIFMLWVVPVVIAQGHRDQKKNQVLPGLSLTEIRAYRKMIRVNEKPIDMIEETKRMCAPPSVIYGPHYDPGVVYYINETARQGLQSFSETRQFPLGSILVKEKQEHRTEDSVQLITVMKKIRSGAGEDAWEYKMYDTKKWIEIKGKKVADGFTRTCLACHRRYKNNDYVSDTGIELLLKK